MVRGRNHRTEAVLIGEILIGIISAQPIKGREITGDQITETIAEDREGTTGIDIIHRITLLDRSLRSSVNIEKLQEVITLQEAITTRRKGKEAAARLLDIRALGVSLQEAIVRPHQEVEVAAEVVVLAAVVEEVNVEADRKIT